MELSTWLIDKSALIRLRSSPDAPAWLSRIDAGQVHITVATLLELGYSARSARELRDAVQLPPLSHMRTIYMTPGTEDLAVEIQLLLAQRGYHRAVSVSDLLIAAAAQTLGSTVLHVDKDFDLISEVTGLSVERLRF
ncbi:MAG: PIN domain nuclease [Thermomicrobiales bacterium]|nr:PIN domain nuclease [Thermomicrobiales bacterium]